MKTTKIYIPVYIAEDKIYVNSNYFFTKKSEAEKYAQEFTNNSTLFKKFQIDEISKY